MKKSKFLVTKTTPPVFFLPKDSTGRTVRALKDTQKFIKGTVASLLSMICVGHSVAAMLVDEFLQLGRTDLL